MGSNDHGAVQTLEYTNHVLTARVAPFVNKQYNRLRPWLLPDSVYVVGRVRYDLVII